MRELFSSRLVNLVQQGEEVVITSQGRAVARLSALSQSAPSSNRRAWLARLRRLRESTATDKTSPTTEQILDDLRSERGSMSYWDTSTLGKLCLPEADSRCLRPESRRRHA
jgi:antitoxin (DNA-binding transcriptional repressor) of toxin-antitoxin stability system